jgi:DNA transformation protein
MDAEAIREIFREAGEIRIRKMFGGQGIYRDDLMFALEAGGELYLKVDADTIDRFRALGSRVLTYSGRDGKPMTMSYWLMPESALEDPEEAAGLAHLAFAAALRGKAKKTRAAR